MGPNTGDKQRRAEKIGNALLYTEDSLPREVEDDADLRDIMEREVAARCVLCDYWWEPDELDCDGTCEGCK